VLLSSTLVENAPEAFDTTTRRDVDADVVHLPAALGRTSSCPVSENQRVSLRRQDGLGALTLRP
jgi:hypothetical protein